MSTAEQHSGLAPTHDRLQAQAREVAARFAGRRQEVRDHLLAHAEPHPELWEAFRERGWPGLVLGGSGSAGGGGAGGSGGAGDGDPRGLLAMALVLEAFAEQGIVLWMPVLSAAVGYAVAQVGPDAVREGWIEKVAAGDAHLAMAATEPEVGHNLFRTRTQIRRKGNGDGFLVSGCKRVTSGLDVADRVLVFGRAPKMGDGPASYTTVLIDPRAPGATMTELPMRCREGVRQFELRLDEVRVPEHDVVGEPGAGLMTMWPFTHVERILTAALCVGGAHFAISRSVERAKSRGIAGTLPIGAEQAIAHPLADLHARLQATRLYVHHVAARFDAGIDGFVVAGEANMAKLLTSDLAFAAADHAMQVHGADAYDEREGWLDLFLDARLARSAPVSDDFARNFVAQHVLGLPAHR